jgi:hypothetical protein
MSWIKGRALAHGDVPAKNAVPDAKVANGKKGKKEFLRRMDQLSLIIGHAATSAAGPL